VKDYGDLLISACKCSSEPNGAESVNSDQQELRERTVKYFTKLIEFIFE